MKFFIPKKGTKIRLIKNWELNIPYVSGDISTHFDFLHLLGLSALVKGKTVDEDQKLTVTIPAGLEFTIERIDHLDGQANHSQVTLLWDMKQKQMCFKFEDPIWGNINLTPEQVEKLTNVRNYGCGAYAEYQAWSKELHCYCFKHGENATWQRHGIVGTKTARARRTKVRLRLPFADVENMEFEVVE